MTDTPTNAPVSECSIGSCQRHGRCMYLNHPRCPLSAAKPPSVDEVEAELQAVRAERDALLQEPINLADMDSIDDDDGTPDRMIAYYWWKQATEARAAMSARSPVGENK